MGFGLAGPATHRESTTKAAKAKFYLSGPDDMVALLEELLDAPCFAQKCFCMGYESFASAMSLLHRLWS
ncbi:MAG TPA: hypothetical protein VHH35_00450, partial [Pyrinomonadaceae bacterium]|nr:hypothetical protein [Pyrinomonadaceae bacterium]